MSFSVMSSVEIMKIIGSIFTHYPEFRGQAGWGIGAEYIVAGAAWLCIGHKSPLDGGD